MYFVKFLLVGILVTNVSFGGTAKFSPSTASVKGNDLLINLPQKAALKFDVGYKVTKRGDSSTEHYITTIELDLKGRDQAAQHSQEQYADAIQSLKTLKYFSALESVMCFVDFEPDDSNDVDLSKGTVVPFSKPINYATPNKKFTKAGPRILLDNYADKSISANFSSSVVRRLYCSFRASGEWDTADFLNDVKISHLQALLAPYFTLVY